MPTAQEIKSAFPGYASWNDDNAIIANFNATGGVGKGGSGSSSSETGTSIPALNFDWTAEKATILKELAPYYESLLKMNKGDIALAKQQLDTDYERGLRVKTEQTTTGIEQNAEAIAERKRKFDIALKDMDQTMNARGIYNSGIKTTTGNEMTADERYQQKLIQNSTDSLSKGLQYYTEDANATRDKQLEKWGMKPVSDANNPTGQYAPSNAGLNTTGYSLSGYVSEPDQYAAKVAKDKATEAANQTQNAYNKAVSLWQNAIKQLT